jgi:F-type H+-transporting ATPase subunit delta
MRKSKLARRYAKAFFEFSQQEDKVEDIIKDVRLIDEVLLEHKEFKVIIGSPIIRTDKKISIINKVFEGKVNKITLQYLTLVIKKGRECQLDLICQEYDKLYKIYKNIITLYVQSAETLEKEIVEIICQKVKSYMGMEIDIVEEMNPKLIGGVRLRFNDYLLDASVSGYIDKLRKELVDRSYEINF